VADTLPRNPSRTDPYKNYRFQVFFGTSTTPVAAASEVSGLTRSTDVKRYRAGGDPSTVDTLPGQTDYQPITMLRGVTRDIAFEQWANKVWDYKNSIVDKKVESLPAIRKDLSIKLLNESGQPVMAYNVYRCWISEFEAMSEFDRLGHVVLIQSITIQNEGWDRDLSVTGGAS